MGDRIIAEPERLEAYAEASRQACSRVSADGYGHATRTYREAQPNDLTCVALADLSGEIEQTREELRRLADEVEAFAWALRQLDQPAGPPGHPTTSMASTTSLHGFLALLVGLRLDMPDATDAQVMRAAGARRGRQVADAVAADREAVAELLEPLDRYGTDADLARGFVTGLGGGGMSDLLDALGEVGDVASARRVGDAFFVGMAAMGPDEGATVLQELSNTDLGVLAAAGTALPSDPVAARFVGIGPVPFMYPVSNAKLQLLEQVVPAEDPHATLDSFIRAKAFKDMLDHPDGFDSITGALRGDRHSAELGNALTAHLTARPEVLDSLARPADGNAAAQPGRAVHLLMGAVAAGDDATGVVAAYSSHRIDQVLIPGNTEILGNLNDAGEAIGRLHAGLEAANATVDVDAVGMIIDTGLVGAGYWPVTAPVMEVGDRVTDVTGIVTNNVGPPDVTTLEDITRSAEQNQRNIVHAIDLLTAGDANRAGIAGDLGLILTGGDAIVVQDPRRIDIGGWRAQHPEHGDLITRADHLADGISSGQRGDG